MKKGWKVFWIIMGVLTGGGIICGSIALAMGLTFSQMEESYPNGIGFIRRSASVVDRNYYDFGGYDDHDDDYDDHDDYDDGYGGTGQFSESYQDITGLEVNVVAMDVIVKKSPDDKAHIGIDDLKFGNTGIEVTAVNESGKLVIRTEKEGNLWTKMISNRYFGELYIYLPADKQLDIAELSIGGSDTHIEHIYVDTLVANIGAGDFEINDFKVNSATVNLGAGDVEMYGEFETDFSLKCGAGSADLTLRGQEKDYNYSMKCGLGEIEIGDQGFAGIAASKSIDNGSGKNIDIVCGAGDVNVEFGY